MSRILRISFMLFLAILGLVFSPPTATALLFPPDLSPYIIQEYWYLPTFYTSVESAVGTLKNLQGKMVGWQGSLVSQWDVDAFGLRTAGIAHVLTETGLFTPDKMVDVQEWTIIPFAEVESLHLVFIENRGSHPYCVKTDLKNGIEIYRTEAFETASALYNALASLIIASGNKLSYPGLGVSFRDVTPNDLWIPGLKEAKGMIVTAVMKGGPAEKGDLRVRDAVIMCNGQPVESIAQWTEKIKPGAGSFDFKVLRKSEPPAVCKVVLPPDDYYPVPPNSLSFNAVQGPVAVQQSGTPPAAGNSVVPPKMGFSLRYPGEAEKKVMDGKSGAVVAELVPGGLAEKGGLKVGDILMECNGKPIQAPETLGTLLAPGENVFRVIRNGLSMSVKVGADLVSY
ncbi:MAG: PDZ domain-containing protein [Thermovirgaceae bacterium]|nr:PDZ domain-containing protein [Thermovirgaceae bacterium]